MKHRFTFLFLLFSVLCISALNAQFVQRSDSLGLVVMPAEKYDVYRPGLEAKVGDTFALEDSIEGFMGQGYMRAYMAKGDGSTSNAETINIKLSYYVNFVDTGTHYIWAYVFFPDGNSDSFFYGVDGKVIGQVSGQPRGSWSWHKGSAPFIIDSVGVHSIDFFGREPNAMLDHIIITSSETFDPNINTEWLPKVIAFVSLPDKIDPATNENADKPFIDDLIAAGYEVFTVYTNSLETASQGLLDSLNSADLVIIGRSGASGDFGGSHKTAWNNIKAPIMLLHLWAARNNRLNWLPTGTTTSYDNAGDTIKAKIVLPADPVFAGITLAEDSTMNWVVSPYDFMATTSGGNGTVLAREAGTSNVLFVRWEPWVEFYDGAGDMPAGYRTLIGNGNDHAGPFNYYNFTPEAKQVYLREVERMVNLPEPPPRPVGLGKTIALITKADNIDPITNLSADQPVINNLLEMGYKVYTLYSAALENASQGLIDTLNSVDLVIIGRSGASADFGSTHKEAWNSITSPLLLLHPWVARNNRLNWLPTATVTTFDVAGDTLKAKIELPDDPVFQGIVFSSDSTLPWATSPYDYLETSDGGNGTVLARDAGNNNVLFVRWEPWVEFYNGSGDMPAGYRTLIGNGNDHAYATTGNASLFNFYNYTKVSGQVIQNEIVRMASLGKVPKPVSVNEKNNLPKTYTLEQNYPNPFNPTTTIKFSVPKKSNVKITIYDLLGRFVHQLVNAEYDPGVYSVQFNAANLSSGVYFYRIEADDFISVKKLMLLK
ncbi:T9SS type A sorting domain-containing protein [Melioribacter sp. OK-6-Me]|uniref:T9SS type A sorting domain-containing protein n=1 Tax=unclassified Melioribacter TaxID=2627329 RepID=UPI003ED86D2A